MTHNDRDDDRRNGAVDDAFGLTRANYLVWPRSLMQEMPIEWQEQFATLNNELWEEFDSHVCNCHYEVRKRDERGRYEADALADYRHMHPGVVDSFRRTTRSSR